MDSLTVSQAYREADGAMKGLFSPRLTERPHPGRSQSFCSVTSTIAVTITPAGPAGTSVKGVLEVSTLNPNTISGDMLAAFPYAYRIQ